MTPKAMRVPSLKASLAAAMKSLAWAGSDRSRSRGRGGRRRRPGRPTRWATSRTCRIGDHLGEVRAAERRGDDRPGDGDPEGAADLAGDVVDGRPTPALASGRDPTTCWLAPGMTTPMPAPVQRRAANTTTIEVLRSRGGEEGEADGGEDEAGADHPADAEPLDQDRGPGRDDHERDGVGQHTEAGLERRVALDELQVLGQQEEHPEQREEDECDRGGAAAEAGQPEQAGIEHRLVLAELEAHEPVEEGGGDEQGADRHRVDPAAAPGPR